MSAPDQPFRPYLVPPGEVSPGDTARGPGDEPDPDRVQRPGADGVIRNGAERMATDAERAGVLEVRGDGLVEEYDAETIDGEDDEIVTGQPVDRDDEDEDEPVLYGKVLARHDAPRPPIVPLWMRTWRDARETAVRELDLWWYRARAHLWNSPLYALRIVRWAPVGAARTMANLWRWTWHAESAPLRKHQAQPGGDVAAYERLHKIRDEHVRTRAPLAGGGLVAAAGGALAAYAWAPRPWLYAAGAGLAVVLARAGRPVDQPIVHVSVTVDRKRKLTAVEIREALCVLGIPGLKDPGKIKFPVDIHRDGPGQLARINLPRGVEAVKVIEKRGALSSALRRPVDQVWPIGGPDHAGQLDLYVPYVPVSRMKPPTWSLTRDGARTSVFEPIEIGTDQRARPVSVPGFELNWLVGGRPGSGKTYFARAIALGWALDPLTEFKIAEFKGTGDFMDFDDAGLCSSYVCGVDDEAFDDAADILAWALGECAKRGAKIKQYRKEGRAPLGKVTPELAAEPGSGLHPVAIILDEVHELFGARPEAADAAERVAKRGRALNIIMLLATQIPDKDSLPKNITRCAQMRACLAVDDHHANNMILGTGAHQRGVTATMFRPKVDAGWAMVTGLEEPTAVRGAFPTEADTRAVLARAVQLRGGTTKWETEDGPRWEVLVDVVRAWPTGQGGVHWDDLAARLAEQRPELYEDLTGEALSAILRGLEVPSVPVTVAQQRARGCRLEAVEAAMAAKAVTSG